MLNTGSRPGVGKADSVGLTGGEKSAFRNPQTSNPWLATLEG